MADLQKTVEIIFGGRNDLSKTIGEVERSLDSLTAGSQPFADMADNVLQAELAVVALGAAFAGLSIAQAGEFSGQFAEITTLIDKNVDDLGGYKQAILEYSTDSTQSLESITGAVYAAISAGTDYTDALDLMSVAEQLAVAGKADLNSTMVALASTLNAYGAEAADAADYSDTFFTTVKLGQTTIPELASSLAQVTGTAAAAGVPFDDLSAAVAALTAYGLPTSQAITSIKAALANIIKPSSDAKTAAEELGIEFSATALKTQGLGGFMQELYKATGGNIETMSRLFGSTEALNGVMALAGDTGGKFADALDAMETRAGATAVAFEKMVDQFDNQNQRLVNNIQTVLIGVGGELLDEYGDIISALISNLKGVGSAIDAGDLDGLVGIFESAMSDIGDLLGGIAEVLPEALSGVDWSGLSGSFDNLKDSIGDAFGEIFGDIDLSTIDGVRDGIQTLVDLLSGLTNVSSGVIDGMQPLFVAMGALAQNFADADASGQTFAGNILGIGKSINEIAGFFSAATSAVGGLSNGLLLLGGSSVINTITNLITKLAGAGGLTAALGSVGTVLGTASGVGAAGLGGWMIGTEINEEINDIVSFFTDGENDSLGGLVYDWIHGGPDDIGSQAAEVVRQVKTIPEAAKEAQAEFVAIDWSENNTLAEYAESVEENLKKISDKENFDSLKAEFVALGNSPEIAAAMANIELETKRIPKAVEDAKKETATEAEKLALEFEKLASNERIKSMELMVDINIAQIEAESKKAVSLIENIGTAIEGTGNLMGDLTSAWSDAGSWDRTFLEDQIDAEERRREEAFDMQKQMTQAEIDLANERTKAIKNGGSLITINGDGLAPHLEAFMFEILNAIQVRVAEDEAQFLVGIS